MNQIHKNRHLPYFFLPILVTVILLYIGCALAVEKPHQGEDVLLDSYHKHRPNWKRMTSDSPLSGVFRAFRHTACGCLRIFDHPFSSVADMLKFRETGAISHPSIQC